MPENIIKVSVSAAASPVAARAGAGDLTERVLGRERRALYETPPARMQPVHPKKLFSAPVSKFTMGRGGASPQLARIRSCLDEYRRAAPLLTPLADPDAPAKAASMEDLTPKGAANDSVCPSEGTELEAARSGGAVGGAERRAADRIGRFMLVVAWRRRRQEVLDLRRTIDTKVWALKSLLEADNSKVVLAMRELDRLKRLLRDKEQEKAVLEREKLALEKDVSAAEDRASELSIGWRNSRNEAAALQEALQRCERERDAERAAAHTARAQRDRAYTRINLLEEELAQHEALLSSAVEEASALRRRQREQATEYTRLDQQRSATHAAEMQAAERRAMSAEREAEALREAAAVVGARLAAAEGQLATARDHLACWPAALTRLMVAARGWLRRPALSEAVLWSLMPSRHGCY